jgi:hypothetical protein
MCVYVCIYICMCVCIYIYIFFCQYGVWTQGFAFAFARQALYYLSHAITALDIFQVGSCIFTKG